MLKQYDETRIEEYGKVIIDVAEDAEISISGKLHLGYNIRKQSEAETYLKLHNNPNCMCRVNSRPFSL